MLQWAVQFCNYYQRQLRSFNIDTFEQRSNNQIYNYYKEKVNQQSPMTSVSNHFHQPSRKAQNMKQQKIFKKKLKLKKKKQSFKSKHHQTTEKQLSNEVLPKECQSTIQTSQITIHDKDVPFGVSSSCLVQKQHELIYQEATILSLPFHSQDKKQQQNIVSRQQCIQSMEQPQQYLTEQIVIYQNQFDYLYFHITSMIVQQLHSQFNNHLSSHRIIITGDSQSGKKHLVGQVIDKVVDSYSERQVDNVHIFVEKQFFSFMNVGYFRNHLQAQSDDQMQEYTEKDQKTILKLQCMILDGFLGSQGEQLIEKYLNRRNIQKHTIQLVFKCLNHEHIPNLPKQQLKNSILIQLPSLKPQRKNTLNQQFQLFIPNFQQDVSNLYQATTKQQLLTLLHKFFINQLQSIQQYINQWLLETRLQKVQKRRVQCSQSVRNFTIKMLVKRYEMNEGQGVHPVLGIKYLGNHLKGYFRAQLMRTCIDIRQKPSKQLSSPQSESQQQKLYLQSSTIANFFNSIIQSSKSSSQLSPLIEQLDLTSLILGLQLVLISCYLYLSHPQYLNSLYINAIKLYPFFIQATKSMKLNLYEQTAYWQFLEKLKEKRVVRFVGDKLGRNIRENMGKNNLGIKGRNYISRGSNCKRKGKKLRMIKDYKNHNFVLLISLDKIKNDFSDLEIYKKFFIDN